jgi:distribution and morphology protein 12
MFMSLPIKLSVTGIVFSGEVAVAYEGERRRVHLCILDDLDPYGPAAKRDYTVHPSSSSSASASGDHAAASADSSPLETLPTPVSLADLDEDGSGSGGGGGGGGRPAKPLPIGQRLLPSIIIESEIGQTDKHVLKNVTRVERFIQDVIRKTVEEELVFPNFHTLVMGEQ